MIGLLIGEYRIVRPIGTGGMGTVYEGQHINTGHRVAIKILHQGIFDSSPARSLAILDEARVLTNIQHRSVVRLIDIGTMPSRNIYFIMEYVDGISLRDYLQNNNGKIPLRKSLQIVECVAEALVEIHRHRIIHLDLKPANIMLLNSSLNGTSIQIRVVDFGISRYVDQTNQSAELSRASIVGTPKYMSPEQCESLDNIDDKSDVYSLGILLYELISGEFPYSVMDSEQTSLLHAHVFERPIPLTSSSEYIAIELNSLIMRMLVKESNDRPSMLDVSNRLQIMISSDLIKSLPDIVPIYAQARGATSITQLNQRSTRDITAKLSESTDREHVINAELESPVVPSRATIRNLLSDSIPSDVELDAFCIDEFESVYKLFSSGMDRTSKINILLIHTPLDQLMAALGRRNSALGKNQIIAKPRQTDKVQSDMASHLRELGRRKAEQIRFGRDTRELDQEIAAIKKQQRQERQGPQLAEGEELGGRYQLLEIVGKGGFARVWQAYDTVLEQVVAVKVLHSDLNEDDTRVRRFVTGALQMKRLRHPGIVQVLAEPALHRGHRYFVMEYLSGGDLGSAVINSRLTRTQTIRIVLDIGDALAFAHTQHIIHRDVKPANILLDRFGHAKLTDFDLILNPEDSMGTRTGPMGTFIYAAPESLENAKNVDQCSDVYSLGMTTIFIFFGQKLPSHTFRNPETCINGLANCSIELKKVLVRAVTWEKEARFQSISEFCNAFKASLSA